MRLAPTGLIAAYLSGLLSRLNANLLPYGMAAVTLQNIFKSYGGHEVLSGVTLDLHKGEKAGLIGANGSGKTTLFRLITGTEPPDMGTVTISGGTTIGYLPQEPDLAQGARLIDVVSSVFDEHRALEAQNRAR